MVNVKNKNIKKYNLAILLAFFMFFSCKTEQKQTVYKVEGKQIPITENYSEDKKIQQFITPYKNHIDKDLDSILAYNPVNQDKSKGKWQTNIGNLLAETTLILGRPIFKAREEKNIDFCMLNHGGIRSVIPKGNVTSRTAYKVMPFENSLVVIGLSGKEVQQLVNYLIKGKKPHPISGIEILLNKEETEAIAIRINDKPIKENQIYYVATSDYLANGGDGMNFFKNSTIKFVLDYKLRAILLDYFKTIDTLPNTTTKNITIGK